MTVADAPRWHAMRTDETREVEQVVRDAGFARVDAYRYNPAAIRVRVIDDRFEGVAEEDRDAGVEAALDRLPERTQADIVTLLTLAPSDLRPGSRAYRQRMLNAEFEDPSPSAL